MTEVNNIDVEHINQLIERVETALAHDLALDAQDMRLILSAIHTLLHIQTKLEDKEMTLYKLRKLLGMIEKSEQRGSGNRGGGNGRKGGKRGGSGHSNTSTSTQHHQVVDLKKGDPCPVCPQGKLVKKEPLEFIRITGSTEYSSEKHVIERLTCNLCDHVVTAEVPKEVTEDGKIGQKYGYSARSMMAIKKYFTGTPYFHQDTLNKMFGQSIRASTLFDQCEYVANDTASAYFELKRQAAKAIVFHIDDTPNRILDQAPDLKKKRNGQGTTERKGVYTSGLIALMPNGKVIYLYETSLGHAGEMIDEILLKRDPNLAAPIIMCDALSRNVPTVKIEYTLAYCNVHARRYFYDLGDKFPETEKILEWYEKIWIHDDTCASRGYDPGQRLDYHKEQSLPIMERIKKWCHDYAASPDYEEHSGLGKACAYFIKHYAQLVMFCMRAGVPIDNNKMEEGLNVPIRTRKNAYFYKTAAGAEVANRLTSLICTAHRNDVNAFHYLNALQRHQHTLRSNPKEWLPWTVEGQYLKG